MNTGQEASSTARAVSAGFMKLEPMPPNSSFTMMMAKAEPTMAIHQGADGGQVQAQDHAGHQGGQVAHPHRAAGDHLEQVFRRHRRDHGHGQHHQGVHAEVVDARNRAGAPGR